MRRPCRAASPGHAPDDGSPLCYEQPRSLVLAAFDAEGQLEWTSTTSGGGCIGVESLVRLEDGGLLVAGYIPPDGQTFGVGTGEATFLEGSEDHDSYVVELGAGGGETAATAAFPGGFFAVGWFTGEGVWGVGETDPFEKTAPPVLSDAFVARYDFAE